jgi:F-box protein 21
LGVAASPTDFPGCVIAHVSSPDPAVSDIFVDVYGSANKAILSLAEDIPMRLMMARVPLNDLMRCISPCSADSLMLRQAKNVFNGLQRQNGRAHPPAGEFEATLYASACAFTIFSNQDFFINELAVIEPLDVKAIQLDLICDALLPYTRDKLKATCSKRLVAEVLENAVSLRSQLQAKPKYFVGMFFTYKTPDRIGCITGWKVRF